MLQEYASPYEKAVFESINSLMMIQPNRDDDLALHLHFKLLNHFPKDLVSLKRAQVLCFYMGRPDLSLQLVQHVLPSPFTLLYFLINKQQILHIF